MHGLIDMEWKWFDFIIHDYDIELYVTMMGLKDEWDEGWMRWLLN